MEAKDEEYVLHVYHLPNRRWEYWGECLEKEGLFHG